MMKKEYKKPCAKFITVETNEIIAASAGNASKKRETTNNIGKPNNRGWNGLWEN